MATVGPLQIEAYQIFGFPFRIIQKVRWGENFYVFGSAGIFFLLIFVESDCS